MPAAGRQALAALAVTVAVGTLAAGCGGGDGGGEQDFRTQANAVCERHTKEIEAATSEALAGGQLPDPRQFGRLAREKIIPEISAQASELRELKAPDGMADDYQQFLGSVQDARQRLEQDPSRITNPANFRDVNRQADQLGLSRSCHIGPD